jgi:putative ABC transport system permease protein
MHLAKLPSIPPLKMVAQPVCPISGRCLEDERRQLMNALWQDVRYGARMLRKNPSFTLITVVTLALGIGANTAIFSFVNGVLLRPLPFPEPERLIVVSEENPQRGSNLGVVSPRNLEDLEQQSQTISQFGAWRDWRFQLATPEGPVLVRSAIASPSLFTVLGVQPVLGRLFQPEENQRGRDHVLLLSHSYWRTQFGAANNIAGQSLQLDNESFTIVGVLPPELEELGLGRYNLWAPLTVDPDQFLGRHVRNRQVYARLNPKVSLPVAHAELRDIAARLAQQYPQDNTGWSMVAVSLHDRQVGEMRQPLLVFLAAVGLLLLIACANVANLMLARGAGRRKEFAIRAALGAGRPRLLRQSLIEALLLALLGGAAGVGLAVWLTDLFLALSPNLMPRVGQVKINSAVLLFAFLLALLTGIVFGLAPGLQAARFNLVEALKDGPGRMFSGFGFRLRETLVVTQIALTLVLLIGAALLGQTFVQLIRVQPGFNPDNLLIVQLFPPSEKYQTGEQLAGFFERITEEFKALPEVESVGATSAGPQFGGYEPVELSAEGQPAPPSGEYPQARYYNIGPDYFRTMQIAVRSGREFSRNDRAGAPAVAVINETLARRFWPNENPVGKRVTSVRRKKTFEIVGVIGDVRPYGLGAKVEPEIYWPYMQEPRGASYFAFRAAAPTASLSAAVRARVLQTDAAVAVVNVTRMDQLVATALKRPRFNMVLLSAFACAGLLLAVVGLYGVMSYTVARQTREFGIRIALGAQGKDILKLVLGQGLVVALLGVAIGMMAASTLTRFLVGLLYGVQQADLLTYGGVAVLMTLVALLACWLPARRAAKADPIIALRGE